MPYHACDRCARKVPGVQIAILDGEAFDMCKRCREPYASQFEPNGTVNIINSLRSERIKDLRTYNARLRIVRERIAQNM
jgi:hypothetical protein